MRARALVLFRAPWSRDFDRLAGRVRASGGRVWFDTDDLIFEPESIGWVHAIADWPDSSKAWFAERQAEFRQALQLSDGVIASTPFLADRAFRLHPDVRVIANTLNAAQLRVAEAEPPKAARRADVTIGYLSGTPTHQADFARAEPALLEALARHGSARLLIIGPLHLEPRWDPFLDRIDRKPFLPYLDMLRALREVDINIAPLEVGNPFCEGKSELKIFEAGAVRTPTIASSIRTYAAAIIPGVDGALAADDDGWRAALERWIADPQARLAAGRAARERALAAFGPDAGLKATLLALGLGEIAALS